MRLHGRNQGGAIGGHMHDTLGKRDRTSRSNRRLPRLFRAPRSERRVLQSLWFAQNAPAGDMSRRLAGVPDVTGKTVREASKMLERAGYSWDRMLRWPF